MKNNPQIVNQHNQTRILDWLYLETQEEDFLMGKTPKDLGDNWEEEE